MCACLPQIRDEWVAAIEQLSSTLEDQERSEPLTVIGTDACSISLSLAVPALLRSGHAYIHHRLGVIFCFDYDYELYHYRVAVVVWLGRF